jgi:hypothetical protein
MTKKWYQFHLLTLVIMILVTGVIAGANLIPAVNHDPSFDSYSYGWPLTLVVVNQSDSPYAYKETFFRVGVTDDKILLWRPLRQRFFSEWLMTLGTQTAIWLLIIVLSIIVCEFTLRHRRR